MGLLRIAPVSKQCPQPKTQELPISSAWVPPITFHDDQLLVLRPGTKSFFKKFKFKKAQTLLFSPNDLTSASADTRGV